VSLSNKPQETGGYYNFSNIPYAEPPIGKNRFAKPVPITRKGSDLNDGSKGHICPGIQVGWVGEQGKFIEKYADPRESISKWTDQEAPTDWGTLPDADPRMSEDCLQLDVVVPTEVYDGIKKKSKKG
jgi:carboxylesterase type B